MVSSDVIRSIPARVAEQSSIAIPLASAREPHFGYFATKRAMDIGVALFALIALSPLFLVVAVAIKLDSRGPVFYRHRRLGRGGQPITCRKFRTMFVGSDRHVPDQAFGDRFKLRDDPRVTRVGRMLRKLSVDELPQLLDVLAGSLSLVGPRPIVEDEAREKWGLAAATLLRVTPGVTGLWQVSGRSSLSYEERIRLDLEYIERRCLVFDLYVLLRTVPAVLTMRGAV